MCPKAFCFQHASFKCCLWLSLLAVIVPSLIFYKVNPGYRYFAANISLTDTPKIIFSRNNTTLGLAKVRPCTSYDGKISAHLIGRLGNHLFQYASLYGIAQSTCRELVIPLENQRILLEVFPNLKITTGASRGKAVGEISFAKYASNLVNNLPKVPSVKISGYLQSFKYFAQYEDALRQQLKLSPNLKQVAADFLHKVLRDAPQGDKATTFVGVHQRRGDIITKLRKQHGYRTADRDYYLRSLDYYRTNYHNVQFVVTGNDPNWIKENIIGPDVTYSFQSFHTDFAILAMCNHSLISVGSFGWWSAWLAGGDVVYYKDAFAPGSALRSRVNLHDYYPPYWKPL